MESLRCPLTLTLYCELDGHAAGVPLGVLHRGPSQAGVEAGVLRRHLLHHQLGPAGMEEGGGPHLRLVEEPGVGEVRARCHAAAQREARAQVGDGGERFRGHPGVLRRSWGKKPITCSWQSDHAFLIVLCPSLTDDAQLDAVAAPTGPCWCCCSGRAVIRPLSGGSDLLGEGHRLVPERRRSPVHHVLSVLHQLKGDWRLGAGRRTSKSHPRAEEGHAGTGQHDLK